jgi:tetratricopeptide (TPR) repeat protein
LPRDLKSAADGFGTRRRGGRAKLGEMYNVREQAKETTRAAPGDRRHQRAALAGRTKFAKGNGRQMTRMYADGSFPAWIGFWGIRFRHLLLVILLFFQVSGTAGACEVEIDQAAADLFQDPANAAALNNFEAAVAAHEYRSALNILEEMKGHAEDNLHKLVLVRYQYDVAERQGMIDAAGEFARQAYSLFKSECSVKDSIYVTWLLNTLENHRDSFTFSEVVEIYGQAIDGLNALGGDYSELLGELEYSLGGYLLRNGHVDDALDVHWRVLDSLEARIGLVDERLGGSIYALAQDYMRAGAYDQAEKLLFRLRRVVEDPANEQKPVRLAQVHDALGQLYTQSDRFDEAEHAFLAALDIASALQGSNPSVYRTALRNLAEFRRFRELELDDPETTALRSELMEAEDRYGLLDERTRRARQRLVERLQELGRASAAETLMEDAVGNGVPAAKTGGDAYRRFLEESRDQ